jgi:hypothetical protein
VRCRVFKNRHAKDGIYRRINVKPFIQMTDEEFMKGLYNEIVNLSPKELLKIYGVENIITEQLNDAIISQWETKQELPFAHTDESTI